MAYPEIFTGSVTNQHQRNVIIVTGCELEPLIESDKTCLTHAAHEKKMLHAIVPCNNNNSIFIQDTEELHEVSTFRIT